MSKNGSLLNQIYRILNSKTMFGQSKDVGKKKGKSQKFIYSYTTFRKYLEIVTRFVKWCIENYESKQFDECRQHVDDFLRRCIDNSLSAWTIKTYACAIAKFYGCSSKEFIKTPDRKRSDIKNNRAGTAISSLPEKQQTAARFIAATGLRKHEIVNLRCSDYTMMNDKMYIVVQKGKGGRKRLALVIKDKDFVLDTMNSAQNNPNGKVFTDIQMKMPAHVFRHQYANEYYHMIARDIDKIPKNERYVCRSDKKGIVYDKKALLEVSRSLGHNRVDVIADHYLD